MSRVNLARRLYTPFGPASEKYEIFHFSKFLDATFYMQKIRLKLFVNLLCFYVTVRILEHLIFHRKPPKNEKIEETPYSDFDKATRSEFKIVFRNTV